MARTIGIGRGITIAQKLPKYKMPAVLVPQDREYFRNFKGLDTQAPLSMVDSDHSPLALNMVFDKKILASRVPLAQYGTVPTISPHVYATDAEIADAKWPIRFASGTLWYRLITSDWIDLLAGSGISLAYSQTGADFVVWPSASGAQLVFSVGPRNNTCVLLSWPPGGDYTTITALDNPNSPSAEHLALFGNRIIASYCYGPPYTGVSGLPTVYPNRVQWCVKDDDTDWHSEGSGTEDLIVLTDDISDDVQGIYPVSDTTAILVRRGSIWRVDLTGFVDEPFQFSLLTNKLGTSGRRTIRAVPGGVIFLGYDDVYVVTLGSITKIGLPALYSVFNNPNFTALNSEVFGQQVLSTVALSWGYYDRYNKLYWLNVKTLGTYVYSFDDQAWTKASFPFEPWSIGHDYFKVLGGEYHGVVVTPDTWSGFAGAQTARQDPTRTQDVDQNGNNIDSPIEMRTGYISLDPLRRVHIVEAQIEYESSQTQTLIFETSVDGQATWQAWATSQAVVTTKGPQVLSARGPFQAANACFRVRSTTLGSLKFYALHVFQVRGALIHP